MVGDTKRSTGSAQCRVRRVARSAASFRSSPAGGCGRVPPAGGARRVDSGPGSPYDPAMAFLLEIDSLVVGVFEDASGLVSEREIVDVDEGGIDNARKLI